MFYVLGAGGVASALLVVTRRNPIISALYLIVNFFCLAGLYLTLNAQFIAVIQIIVYAGAIMVLFVLVIMLLNAGVEERTQRSRLVRQFGAPLIVMLLGILTSVIYRQFPGDAMVRFGDFPGQTSSIGLHLFLDYMLPFEVVSILILVAIIGAVVLAQRET